MRNKGENGVPKQFQARVFKSNIQATRARCFEEALQSCSASKFHRKCGKAKLSSGGLKWGGNQKKAQTDPVLPGPEFKNPPLGRAGSLEIIVVRSESSIANELGISL
jgi:hypothetical protein